MVTRPGADGRLPALHFGVGAPGLPAGAHRIPVPGRRDGLLVVPDRRDPAAPAPLLVFCHGAGGAPAGAGELVATAVSARALLLLPASAGRTWDLVMGSAGSDTVALGAALRHVAEACPVDPSRVAIGGFSDGGSYALSMGLANGDVFRSVLALSPGFVAAPGLVGRPRVFVSHGTQDTVLPVDRCGRRVVAQLQEAGYVVRYEEFDGPHVVPPVVADVAVSWWLDSTAEPLR